MADDVHKIPVNMVDDAEELDPDDIEVAVEENGDRVADLEAQIKNLQEQQRRAQADYQNLHRRTQDDRAKMAKMASLSVIESILQPLDHLILAKDQLKDKGLDMVVMQFQQALAGEGLEEIDVMGKKFDSATMEVIDKVEVKDKKDLEKVMKVVSRGYRLNGEVIRHAKVVVGAEKEL